MMKRILGLGLFLSAFAFAEDISATTSNGSVVILHDNGRWEYYNNNSKVRDIRESAIPKDMQTTVSIEYESPEKLRKDMRMRMDADFATEEEIKDSLRTLPAGGIVHFAVPESQVHRGNPRTFTYTVWVGKKQVYKAPVSESQAVPSETAGVTYLLSVPLHSKVKGKSIKARVEDAYSSIDFDVR
ncbi:MAG: hypothetical protein J6Z31_09830 [Fibrobacter sp.]|nr:hypothetical protein [Fibrobacter sp.]